MCEAIAIKGDMETPCSMGFQRHYCSSSRVCRTQQPALSPEWASRHTAKTCQSSCTGCLSVSGWITKSSSCPSVPCMVWRQCTALSCWPTTDLLGPSAPVPSYCSASPWADQRRTEIGLSLTLHRAFGTHYSVIYMAVNSLDDFETNLKTSPFKKTFPLSPQWNIIAISTPIFAPVILYLFVKRLRIKEGNGAV